MTGVKAGALAVGASALLLGGWALLPGGDTEEERPPAAQRQNSPAAGPSSASPLPSPTPTPSATSSQRSPSASTSASASLPASALGGPGTLRFVSTGSCLSIAGDSAKAGARPTEAVCGGGAGQRWRLLEPYADDRKRTLVRNEASGLCLTRSGSTADHSPVDQQPCDKKQANQLWNLWSDSDSRQAALRDAPGTRYLGLNDWAKADQDQTHGAATGTTAYYYGSDSMRFRYETGMIRD